jgi:hypothetical protein
VAAVVLGALALATVTACGSSGGRGKDGQVTKPTNISVFDLRVGDCIQPPAKVEPEITKVKVVPCKDSHTMETFAIAPYKNGDDYPGDSEMKSFADVSCLDAFQDYIGVAYPDSSLFYTYLLPSARSWNEGHDRKVVCEITTTGAPLTDSVKGSKR